MAHPFGERDLVEQTASKEPMTLDSFGGRIHVRWSPDEAVTPLGQLPFFIDFLKQANLLELYVEECPLQFSSPNAPEVRDVLGTLLMSIVTGGRRYAHVNALRHDGINPPLLGMSKVCSDDSVRRALKSIDQEKADVWLKQHLTVPLHPIMQDGGWILDVDSTVKPIYGKQEGAEVGYNPNKRGRPSHCYHSYLIANLRLVLGVDVTPGNESNSPYSLPGLLEILDDLPAAMRPFLVRADRGYGNDAMMSQGNRLNKPLTRLYFLNRGVRAHLFFRRFRMSCTPNDSTAPAFLTHFQAVEDPRQEGEVLYPLEEILLLVLCGVISGADGWTSIALYGQKKLELLRRFLPYENGTPSHDQLGILFSRLDMEVFQSCFISWVASLNETLEGVVAADGKTLRRSFDTSSSRAAIHMVSAWACDQKLVLGQRKVDDKSNEITAIPELLELLKIKGAIVAIDAMGCQRKICKNPVIKRRIM